VEGQLSTNDLYHLKLERGANVLIPLAGAAVFKAVEASTLLVTEKFV
jgi:hypothetical protein